MAASEIGARLRRARQARGLSLRSVANSVGVSASLISQVETGKTDPSLATLTSLAGLLSLSIDDLLGLAGDGVGADGLGHEPDAMGGGRGTGGAHPYSGRDGATTLVQRAEENPAIEMENGVRWERLAGDSSGPVDMLLVTYQPGAASSVEGKLLRHLGFEYAYMLSGVLTLQVEFDSFELQAGDSLQFDPTRPHMFANRGTEPARGVWFIVGRREAGAAPTARPPAGTVPSSAVEVLQRIESFDDLPD